MKKYLTAFTILLLLTGCSYLTRFVITNETNESIKINYSIKTVIHSETGEEFCPTQSISHPEVTQDSLWRFNTGDWVRISEERYFLNKEKCSIVLSIEPEQSASITRTLGYPGHDHSSAKSRFDLSALTIRSKEGSITLEGWELQKRFEKIREDLYVFLYQ